MGDTRDFSQPDKKTIENIIHNYAQNEKALVEQLYFATSHGPTIGGFREDIWKSMFEQIIPKKFVIEQSVFIIDSAGRVSNEVDLAIFDETYTPYIFRYGRLKFIPIEAVAVVVECKSQSLKPKDLKKWAESIAALTTSLKSYTRIASGIIDGKVDPGTKILQTQTQTRPLRILCCLNENIGNGPLENGEKMFDIIAKAPSKQKKKRKRLKIEFDEDKKSLQDWYLALNHVGYQQNGEDGITNSGVKINNGEKLEKETLQDYQIKAENGRLISLLTFNLQLNQLLMLINNPIPFPHKAYVEMFNRFAKGEKPNE